MSPSLVIHHLQQYLGMFQPGATWAVWSPRQPGHVKIMKCPIDSLYKVRNGRYVVHWTHKGVYDRSRYVSHSKWGLGVAWPKTLFLKGFKMSVSQNKSCHSYCKWQLLLVDALCTNHVPHVLYSEQATGSDGPVWEWMQGAGHG